MNAEQKKLPFEPIFDILYLGPDEEKGGKMTRQLQNRQGRIINPLHTILFFSALLVFIFTVVYRMVKSENFSTAMATLVESLLIVSFFIFLGIFLAYLFYFIHEKIHQGSRHKQLWDMFVNPSTRNATAGKSDPDSLGIEQNDEVGSRSNS
jgi:predicted PurR-regulated permease PerM